MKKKVMSFLLCVMMVFAMIPATALRAMTEDLPVFEGTEGSSVTSGDAQEDTVTSGDAQRDTVTSGDIPSNDEEQFNNVNHSHTAGNDILSNVRDAVPECDCGVESVRLEEHNDGCARKKYCKTVAESLTAQEIYAVWEELPEDVREFVLTYLSWISQAKLKELQEYIENGLPGTEVTLPDGITISASGEGLPEGIAFKAVQELLPARLEVINRLGAQILGSASDYPVKEVLFSSTYNLSMRLKGEEWQPQGGVSVTLGGFAADLSEAGIVVTHMLDTADAVQRALADGSALSYSAEGLEAVYPEEVKAAREAGGAADTVYYVQLRSGNDEVTVNSDNTITFTLDSFSPVNILGYGIHKEPYIPNIESEDPADRLVLNKTIAQEEDGSLSLYLESYATGSFKPKPTEVVAIVDQSGSMYSAVEPYKLDAENLQVPRELNLKEFLATADKEKASKYPGYYVVVIPNRYASVEQKEDKRTHAVALLRYNKSADKWQRTMQRPITEDNYLNQTMGFCVDKQNNTVNVTRWYDLLETNEYNADYFSENAVCYKSIYGAIVDGLNTFVDRIEGLEECNVAVVGFASAKSDIDSHKPGVVYPTLFEDTDGIAPPNTPEETKLEDAKLRQFDQKMYGGTGIFVNGQLMTQTQCIKDPSNYNKAFMSAGSDLDKIRQSIDRIDTNFWNTTTDAGFELANQIFANSPNNGKSDINRTVVLFTDGVPDHATVDGKEIASIYDPNYVITNGAIQDAYITKNTYGANVYVFGPNSNAGSGDKYVKQYDFMRRLSSYYPEAQNMTDEYEVGDVNAFGMADNAEQLEYFFDQLGQKIYNDMFTLDKDAVLKDVLTAEFEVNVESTEGIQAWRVPCVVTAGEDGRKKLVFDDEHKEELPGENIIVDGKTISVTGFDYAADIISEGALKDPNRPAGAKVVIKIPIIISEDYVGNGVGLLTNDVGSGVYDKDGNPVNEFEKPKVDAFTTVKVRKTVKGNSTSESFKFSASGEVLVKYESTGGIEPPEGWVIGKSGDEDELPNSQGGNYLQAETKTENYNFDLDNGKSISFSNVKVGSEFIISESVYDEYITTVKVNGKEIAVSADGKYKIPVTPKMEIEVVNTYKRADLTLKKEGCDEIDENQTFLFHVKGVPNTPTADVDMKVTVVGNGEVTVKELPVGDYIITEESGWGWRYAVSNVRAQSGKEDSTEENVTGNGAGYPVTLPVENLTVWFTNRRDDEKWIDGNSWCRNLFDGKDTCVKAPDTVNKDGAGKN